MSHAVENIAYAGETPWHGLGFPVAANLSAAEMRKAAKQDYHVSKRPMYVKVGDEYIADKKTFQLVRDSDNAFLSAVGTGYRPVQTEQVFDFFHDFVKSAKMRMETAGSLWEGRYVWALARINNSDYVIGKKDEMRNYLLLCSPFEHGKALIMQYTSVRVVCWNTLTMAVGQSLKGRAHAFRMPHTKDFAVEKETAKKVLGLVTEQSKEFEQAAKLLAKKRVTDAEADKFFLRVLGVDKGELKEGERAPMLMPKFKAARELSPGAQLPSSKGTWWGAVNAVTWTIDHEVGKSRSTALKNAWLGNHADTKRRALEMALVEAK